MSKRDRTLAVRAHAPRRLRVMPAPDPTAEPALPPEPSRGPVALDEPVVAGLQAVRDYPCASVLMSTAPAAAMTPTDAARLDRLVAAAERRLRVEVAHHPIEPLLARLARLAQDAKARPTTRAVALFASFHHDALVDLPVHVVDRVVVDPTFATRDLVRALAARPRVRVVVVSERTVRLLEGATGGLVEIDLQLPAVPTGTESSRGRRSRRSREDGELRRRRGSARLRHATTVVRARHDADPLPMVVAGVTRQVAAWTGVFGDEAVVGAIPGSHDTTSVARLDLLVAPVVDDHRRFVRKDALARLAATEPARIAFGIDAVWTATGAGRIDLLCVEESYVYPARPDLARNRLQPDDDLDRPEVLDDAIDEIIEMVRLGDGRVVTVHDGALEGYGRIAARLRWG
jgi:hypothetical protein